MELPGLNPGRPQARQTPHPTSHPLYYSYTLLGCFEKFRLLFTYNFTFLTLLNIAAGAQESEQEGWRACFACQRLGALQAPHGTSKPLPTVPQPWPWGNKKPTKHPHWAESALEMIRIRKSWTNHPFPGSCLDPDYMQLTLARHSSIFG